MKFNQAHKPQSNLQWLLGAAGMVAFTAISAYAAWVNGSIKDTNKAVTDLQLANVSVKGHLDVIDTKIDLILDALDIDVQLRPAFHQHNQDKQ